MKKFFELSGLTVVTKPDTYTHEIIVMDVNVEGRTLEVEALRSKKAPHGDFLPASVRVKGQKERIWSFQELKVIGFTGLAKLFRLEPKGQPHIDLIGLTDRNGFLVSVIPLHCLGNGAITNTENYGLVFLGGKLQPHELMRLKSQLAHQEGLVCQFTSAEQALLKDIFNLEEAEVKAEQTRREAARLERRKAVLSRPQITAYTKAGEKVRGVPVASDEWEVLGNGQTAVLVETYDQETGQPGKPLEAFRVEKTRGGRTIKCDRKTGITLELSKPEAMALAFKMFRIDGILSSMPVVSRDELDQLRQKLNSGTKVAVPEGDKFKIYSLEKGKSHPIGVFASL